jgi:hypothetical protein
VVKARCSTLPRPEDTFPSTNVTVHLNFLYFLRGNEIAIQSKYGMNDVLFLKKYRRFKGTVTFVLGNASSDRERVEGLAFDNRMKLKFYRI